MSAKLYVLFNHSLTMEQHEDAYTSWGISEIVLPDQGIQNLWSQIPPDLDALDVYLTPVFNWLTKNTKRGDYLLIQGEFGATYTLVCFAQQHNLTPVYATTRRQAVELNSGDGSVELIHTFKHVRYRQYKNPISR